MGFIADKQTLDDLNITGRFKHNSMFRLFDTVKTEGGRKLLEEMFRHPLQQPDLINQRVSVLRYFESLSASFPLGGESCTVMDNYLSSVGHSGMVQTRISICWKKMLETVTKDEAYKTLHNDICITIELLNELNDFANRLQQHPENAYSEELRNMKSILDDKRLQWVYQQRGVKSISVFKLSRYDYVLRTGMNAALKTLISIISALDVYMAVSGVARKKGFSYPVAYAKESNFIEVTNLYHPAIENAVGNSLSLQQFSNLLFLTGANMAGKSTFMKSFGIAVYMAHMGFPVAAKRMNFSIRDGLYSSINVPDNLDQGYSHFYAEVLRVKQVAEEVSNGKDLVVIFDELFKGTNVKDAYDATMSITEAFAENRNCFFIISTHIIEVGEALRERCNNMQFTYLPTVMEGNIPRYPYTFAPGITADRQGMIIIENEGILDILNKKALTNVV